MTALAAPTPNSGTRTVFFMIVTPVDLGLARYTIQALGRMIRAVPHFSGIIYCNGLSREQVRAVASLTDRYERLACKDNSPRMRALAASQPGEWYTTDLGNRELRQGAYEASGEVWSRELVRLEGDCVAMVDADLEILEADFARYIAHAFSEHPQLAVFATDHKPRRCTFETYAQEDAVIAERWDTWFCVYRRSALEKYHDFSYAEERSGEHLVKYDHSAKLQDVLLKRYGYEADWLRGRYAGQYLHYGAFAKNRSLCGRRLWLYRLLRIGRENGWVHRTRSPLLAAAVRRLSSFLWQPLGMSKFDTERERYLFDA